MNIRNHLSQAQYGQESVASSPLAAKPAQRRIIVKWTLETGHYVVGRLFTKHKWPHSMTHILPVLPITCRPQIDQLKIISITPHTICRQPNDYISTVLLIKYWQHTVLTNLFSISEKRIDDEKMFSIRDCHWVLWSTVNNIGIMALGWLVQRLIRLIRISEISHLNFWSIKLDESELRETKDHSSGFFFSIAMQAFW